MPLTSPWRIALLLAVTTLGQDASASILPDSVKQCFKASGVNVLYPDSPRYSSLRSQNANYHYKPSAILEPVDKEQVSKAISCVALAKGDVKTSVFGGGHGYAAFGLGGADGHVVIWMHKLTSIDVDVGASTAKVGAGVTLGNLATRIGQDHFALPHGTCPSVGVVGHALGGGWGFTSRKWGWLMDRIVELEYVDPTGKAYTVNNASEGTDQDVWWAMRGAGAGNFGAVTSLTFKLAEAPRTSVIWNTTFPNNEECAKALLTIQELGLYPENTPQGLETRFGAQLSVYGEGSGNPGACSFSGQFLGPVAELSKVEKKISENLKGRKVNMTPFDTKVYNDWVEALTGLMGPLNATYEPYKYYAKSLIDDGSPGYTLESALNITNAVTKTVKVSDTISSISFDLNGPSAGTNGEQPNGDSVFEESGKRASLFLSQLYVNNYPGFNEPSAQEAINKAIDAVDQAVIAANPSDEWGAYANYVDPRLKDFSKLYWGKEVFNPLPRLKDVKRRIDPSNIFDFPQGLAHA